MKLKLKKILQQPEMQELAITLIGLSAGFVAKKLLSVVLRKNLMAELVGKVVQIGVTTWIANHPEWIDETVDLLMQDKPKRRLALN